MESITRRWSGSINKEILSKKDYLWSRRKNGRRGMTILYDHLIFLEEDLYLNIPFPFKQQK